MWQNPSRSNWPSVAALLALGAAAAVFSIWLISQFGPAESPTEKAIAAKLRKEGLENLHFDLVDPGQAPEPIRDLVQLGYQIMLHTPENASDYVGDRLNCTNCHFGGGNTIGGKQAGIALAGVAATYPNYNARMEKVLDLPARINNCFMRSMNGKALPLDSKEMLALVTYFQWISNGFPIYREVPWLGLPHLRSNHVPDPLNGQKIYADKCALCHGVEGLGEVHADIPPLWGPHSYNVHAGMQNVETLASFVYSNMPYNEPSSLSVEQALDVAAFISQQPRPHAH